MMCEMRGAFHQLQAFATGPNKEEAVALCARFVPVPLGAHPESAAHKGDDPSLGRTGVYGVALAPVTGRD